MEKKIVAYMLLAFFGIGLLTGCGSNPWTKEKSEKDVSDHAKGEENVDETGESTEIQVFIAASLNKAMTQIAEEYNKLHPEVKILFNADSSGTLLTQIQEGYECDLFFSAAEKQVDMLEKDGLLVEGTRADVVNNQVVVIARKDSRTKVAGLKTLNKAESIALAGGSVPVGKYTRQAMINLGMLEKVDDAAAITTEQISGKLGGVEISEQANVSKVLLAVIEGSCEVGTTYYSDTYGYEDELEILEYVSYDLTGDVIYPICMVENEEADDVQTAAAEDFYEFVLSDRAKEIFESYYFDSVSVQR